MLYVLSSAALGGFGRGRGSGTDRGLAGTGVKVKRSVIGTLVYSTPTKGLTHKIWP